MPTPLCPDCKKQMTVRYICVHCGYDDQRRQTMTNRRVTAMPYLCVRDGNATAKKIDGIPVCGECFTQGWGRLPDMALVIPPVPVTNQFTGEATGDIAQELVEAINNGKIGPVIKPKSSTPILTPVSAVKMLTDYKCPNCKRKLKTKQRLEKHITKIHGGK